MSSGSTATRAFEGLMSSGSVGVHLRMALRDGPDAEHRSGSPFVCSKKARPRRKAAVAERGSGREALAQAEQASRARSAAPTNQPLRRGAARRRRWLFGTAEGRPDHGDRAFLQLQLEVPGRGGPLHLEACAGHPNLERSGDHRPSGDAAVHDVRRQPALLEHEPRSAVVERNDTRASGGAHDAAASFNCMPSMKRTTNVSRSSTPS